MIIKYQVPRLGMLKVQLYGFAQKIYDLLAQYGHIDRMRDNPQLGVIRGVCEGAHHTRWEYVVTQLYLINKLKECKEKATGLSNDTPRIRGEKISGAEIIQSWILLLNAGHLLGTFASERGLLMAIKDDPRIRNTIRGGLPKDSKIKEHFNKIIETEDIYRLHEILSYFILNRHRRGRNKDIAIYIDILKLYRFEPSQGEERRRKLRSLFLRIRQASYLYLDSSYSPVPITFDLGPILFDFEQYVDHLSSFEQTPLGKSLDSFENMMVDTFYLSAESIYALGWQAWEVYTNLIKLPDSEKTISSINNKLLLDHMLTIKTWQKSSERLLRLWIDTRDQYQPAVNTIKTIDLEDKWNSRLPTSKCHCTIATDPKGSVLGINLSFEDTIKTDDLPKIFSTIIGLFMNLQEHFLQIQKAKKGSFGKYCFTQSCKELILYILKQLWGKMVTFIPNPHTVLPDFWLMFRGSTNSSIELRKIAADLELKGMDPDRLHEVKALSEALKNTHHRGTVLMTTGQIIVRRCTDHSDITDLDGIAICVDSREFSLIIVESKNMRSGGIAAARSRLQSTMTEMGIPVGNQPAIITLTGYGAYTRICLYESTGVLTAPDACEDPASEAV